jgi:mannose-6-phosphate isomerase-like protein (cupin superfamily)
MKNETPTTTFQSRFTNARELTNGQRSEGILTLEPNEKGPPEHIHTKQLEYFEVVSGELIVRVNGEDIRLKAGERTEISKSVRHTYFNDTDQKVVAIFGYEPALNIQYLLDTMEMGDKKNGGNWNEIPIFEIGYLLYHFRDEYRLAKLPFWLQDVVFGTFSRMAKITGISDKIRLPNG